MQMDPANRNDYLGRLTFTECVFESEELPDA